MSSLPGPSPTLSTRLLIVGAGPAGYTAAIYAARAALSPLMVRGPEPGGQLMITTDVENYPGFRQGIMGPQLMEEMAAQALHVGTVFQEDRIRAVNFTQRPLICYGEAATYVADAVVIATGASARWLGLESETAFRGYGVSACATCDGFFFKGKRVAVVGGGNSAVEEALFLTHHAAEVIVIHRREALRAEKILQKRAFENPKIRFIWNHVVADILGETEPRKRVTGVRLKNVLTDAQETLALDGVFVAVGHTPNTDFLVGALHLDKEGYVAGSPDSQGFETATEIPGVFVAGDVKDKVYRQAITAAGQGCMAALDAEKYLSTLPSS